MTAIFEIISLSHAVVIGSLQFMIVVLQISY